MIYDSWENIGIYRRLMPDAVEAMQEFMRNARPDMEEKTYPLLGEELKASVFSYRTRALADSVFEIHRQCIDLQTVLAGCEINYCGNLRLLKPRMEFDSAGDYQLFEADLTDAARMLLTPGRFAVYFPDEPHLTALANAAPEKVKKVVFKINHQMMEAHS